MRLISLAANSIRFNAHIVFWYFNIFIEHDIHDTNKAEVDKPFVYHPKLFVCRKFYYNTANYSLYEIHSDLHIVLVFIQKAQLYKM